MTSSPGLILEARQHSLPRTLHTQSPQISSVLHDPLSQSLALRHSDSSFSLYPSFSPLSAPNFPPNPQTLIPPPTSSAAFLHLRAADDSTVDTLFLASSPHLPQNSTLLRFHVLRSNRFARIRVVSSHRDLEFDRAKSGVVFKVNHGVSMKLSGGTNLFSLYSVSDSKIWVFAVRLVGDDGGGEALKLIKCAVIDCCFRVFEIKVLFGFLVLGEENGVRLFPLRPLVKRNYRKDKKNGSRKALNSHNVVATNGGKSLSAGGDLNMLSAKGEKGEKNSDPVKLRLLKLRQDSKDMGAFFVAFEDAEGSFTKMPGKSVKAISIQALSANKFVILDSAGNLHLLCLSYSIQGLYSPRPMQQLTRIIKIIKLAVFHEVSTVTRTVWICDGSHTVHLLMVSDSDTPIDDTKNKDTEEKVIQTSVAQTIFASEKIKDVVPLAAESMLILGQESLFVYAIHGPA